MLEWRDKDDLPIEEASLSQRIFNVSFEFSYILDIMHKKWAINFVN